MTALRLVACWLIAGVTARAAVVQGVVLEQVSGRPMARTQMRLVPISRGKPFAVRTSLAGQYSFLSVPEGLYILTASRRFYFPSSYGQRLPGGWGTALEVKEDSRIFIELRMRRMGAISGRVLDENGIGLPDIPVVAYRARLPLRIVANAISDDRGVYRIPGLDAGKYWVRTAAHTLEDGTGMLPFFSPEANESRDSRAYSVAVDQETTDADIHPQPGPLFRLGGIIQCEPAGFPVTVRLSTETGTRTNGIGCGQPYSFDGLSPAPYEVFAEKQDGTGAGFIELFLDHDNEAGTIRAGPLPKITITYQRPDGSSSTDALTVTGRRSDLAEAGAEIELKQRQAFAPGRWEMSAKTGPNDYVESIASYNRGPRLPWRAERRSESFEVFLGVSEHEYLGIVIPNTAGHIAGVVQTDKTPVPGIPVFLWPVAEAARRSLRGPLQMLSDANGKVRFDGLPPGDYRLLATYDLTDVDEETMDATRAVTVHVDKSQTASVELGLWQAP